MKVAFRTNRDIAPRVTQTIRNDDEKEDDAGEAI